LLAEGEVVRDGDRSPQELLRRAPRLKYYFHSQMIAIGC
jgi:hypothetical protein